MSRRRQLEEHRRSLGEIGEIMNSMKTLAYMETRKLTRFLESQQRVVKSIEGAAGDLLHFYPEILPTTEKQPPILLLVGSERGFCGDFNHTLLTQAETLQKTQDSDVKIIAIGHKLCTLLENDPRLLFSLDGAGVVEEVTPLLNRLVNELSRLQSDHGSLSLVCLYHESQDQLREKQLLPPFQELSTPNAPTERFSLPPLLNLQPQTMLLQLTEQYIFAALYEILYTSLMAENLHRVGHLEGAVKHLDEESATLVRTSNVLRQEEITEEIEVILLSADNSSDPGRRVDKNPD